MSLIKRNMPLSAKQVSIMDKNGKFNYDHIVQRGLVWEKSRKTGLIESMILGYPIPQVYCRRDVNEGSKKKGDSDYVVMDGKQRLTTIASFLQDAWALTALNPVTYVTYTEDEETVDISGRTFSELPEEIQDTIKDTIINFIYFEQITFEEERELFKRLNAGKPLSTKARLIANCADLKNILEVGEHSIFNEMLTENALSQKNQVSVVMKVWAMINKPIEEVSFESKIFNALVESTEVSYNDRLIVRDILDFMKSAHSILIENGDKKTARKLYTETHFVSLVPFVLDAYMENTCDEEEFSEWVTNFFNEETEDPEDKALLDTYLAACQSGSAKNENIQIRNNALRSSYNKHFQKEV